MAKLFIEDLELQDKKVITRVDFNVPLRDGNVDNDKRLRASLPTIKYLVQNGAKVILMSHLGRPKGQVVETMSMAPVAKALGELLGQEVKFVPACIGADVQNAASALKAGEVLLLENLRFHKEETDNDAGFAKELASLADLYVNDAFGTAHRAHASTEGITKNFSQCACGYLIKKELDFLGGALNEPKKPFVAIIGGAKISGKIDVIEALLSKVDKLIIGGGMTYTFFKAMGLEIGNSLCEDDKVPLAKSLLEKAGDKIQLPVDSQITTKLDFANRTVEPLETVSRDGIKPGTESVDIGPETITLFSNIIKEAKTLVWNGPMGVFEIAETAKGTFSVAEALAEATKNGGVSIIGGGDSASAIEKAGLADKVSHVSTGGGASLEFLEGKKLPGVEALTDK
ncbi:MAG: phosphoglycerate kinase [Fibrobacteria bacterium]|nr:phosphoglycerate kinase [Fibrobacteria bacterium]